MAVQVRRFMTTKYNDSSQKRLTKEVNRTSAEPKEKDYLSKGILNLDSKLQLSGNLDSNEVFIVARDSETLNTVNDMFLCKFGMV